MTKSLKLYKASAGSGKTFTLAVEYIKLLVNNPDEYKSILAVTFTNKATGEMKNRILSKLYGIANSLPDGEDYLSAIKADKNIQALELSDVDIRKRCADALNRIIHDYSRFRIETIDSFFQSIIRDLTRELDLTANLRVDLNAEEVLEEAVNTIIEELDKTSDVFDSVYRFVEEKINEGGNWQINNEVADFGKNIFKEDFLRNREVITNSIKDPQQLRKYKSEMQSRKKRALENLSELGKGFLSQMEAVGVSFDQFKYGSTLSGFVNKMANGIIPDVSSRIEGYVNDVNTLVKDKKVDGVIRSEIHPLLEKIVSLLPDFTRVINSVDAICKHLNHLMLLNVINEKVRDLNSDANRFLLADSAHFLNDIIDGSDIPFVYEKAGTWFKHIMIDEFQDTSALQWENFKPLIKNSMSSKDSCLIVGDVKQSIYRWRDSDWQILNKRINEEFPRDLDPDSLKTNYRSAGNVIHFNNQFFNKATQLLNADYRKIHNVDSEDLLKAYSDVRQLVPAKNEGEGYVLVDNYVAADYLDQTPQRILEMVKKLHEEDGIAWNDMTILVRKNKLIPTLCQYFYEHKDEIGTKIVSDEAFRLDSSSAINLIIFALIAISNPDVKFALRNLAIHYQMAMHDDIEIKNDANRYFLASDEEVAQYLPDGFIEKMEYYAVTPLYELIEELYEALNLKTIKGQDAYLFYFHDLISNYVQDNQTDIDSFLAYWDDKMCEKTIPNGASDGIRIMSIHKSKGLEFHTVIVPYCDWDTRGNHNDLLWCKPYQEPYNELPIVPVSFTTSLGNSIFDKEYNEEVLRNNVDNLNLIYVAFTRASKNLIVLTGMKPKKSVPSTVSTIQQIISGSMERLMTFDSTQMESEETPITLVEEKEEDSTRWILGSPIASKVKEKEKATENVLEKPYKDFETSFIHQDAHVEFRQSNDSKALVFGNDEEDETSREDYIERGNIYHKIFELIKTKDDVDKVIDELDGCGYFNSVLSVDEARKNIKLALEDETAGRWFEGGWREFKECTIMFKDKNGGYNECRPDRVIMNENETIVIDYKSGKENPHHKKQVSWYMYLLDRMGYKNIKGYIWYFMNNKIEEVINQKGGKK